MTKNNRYTRKDYMLDVFSEAGYENVESKPWNSGFSMFKRRIDEQLQLNGFDDSLVDDEILLPFYRNGESENYVLSALGCTLGS